MGSTHDGLSIAQITFSTVRGIIALNAQIINLMNQSNVGFAMVISKVLGYRYKTVQSKRALKLLRKKTLSSQLLLSKKLEQFEYLPHIAHLHVTTCSNNCYYM